MPELILTIAAGPERVVEELLGAAPGHLHRLADRFGQPRGFDACWLRVLPPNPPPTKGVMTRTFSRRQADRLAQSLAGRQTGSGSKPKPSPCPPSIFARAVWVSMAA